MDTIIEKQQKQLSLLRKILANTQGPDAECSEDILAMPCDSVEELEDLCQRREENPEHYKIVIRDLFFSDKTVIMSKIFTVVNLSMHRTSAGTPAKLFSRSGGHVVFSFMDVVQNMFRNEHVQVVCYI
ncbi:hypothetical protein CHS0354_021937 [Potamilus streckersoni]|uniref:Uncharacterized protein n=1 Tax=Potamilus streckersoni TaxID=2493646 RepID=A0AAE0VX95_9BIVA|nr:hypothetical protein CHS0354_021937 [Potamilus streckersoni]